MRLRILDEFSCCNDMAIFKRNYTLCETQQFINHLVPKQRRNYDVKRFCCRVKCCEDEIIPFLHNYATPKYSIGIPTKGRM